jgi:antitoxin HicB
MKTVIPCKITNNQNDDCWYVESPGFYDGVITDGETLEQAKSMASEAVNGLLASYIEHDRAISVPRGEGPDWYNIEVEPGLAFAFWLRKTRVARHMSVLDAASRMGIKYQTYQKLENPRTANPTLKTIRKIERVFDTELVSL